MASTRHRLTVGADPTGPASPIGRRRILALAMGLGGLAATVRPPLARDRPASSDTPVARVTRIAGIAEMDELAGRGIRRLRPGARVFIGDRVITGVNTRAAIALRDGTALILGELSLLTVDGFAYDISTQTGRAMVSLRGGVMRMLPGGIHALFENGVTVRTPVALVDSGDSDIWAHQSARQAEFLLLGGSGFAVRNPAGSVTVSEIGAVSTVAGRNEPPTEPVALPPAIVEAARLAVSF